MKRPVSHLLDVYSVHLHLADNDETWDKLRRKYDCLPEAPTSMGFTQDFGHASTPNELHVALFVNVALHLTHGDLIDTIAHEAVHAMGDIFDHIDQPIRGDEAAAYLTGWISRWVWEHIDDVAA